MTILVPHVESKSFTDVELGWGAGSPSMPGVLGAVIAWGTI